jgi:FMN phosphatase YigB (HAD superfamily)
VKPEPEIYRLAMRNLSVGPADCIFVGDGGSEELRGARDLGITTVMITDITACPEIPGESFDLALACACFGRLIEDETEGQMPYRIAD